jgi:hypothetical protein
MTSRQRAASQLFAATVGFLAGMAVMSLITVVHRVDRPAAVTQHVPAAAGDNPRMAVRPSTNDVAPVVAPPVPDTVGGALAEAAVDELRKRRFALPVHGATREQLQDTFDDARSEGRRHEALDLLAPRHTPVVAVEDGTIARLLTSAAGGISVYQFDPTTRYAYYYAHLDRYADGLSEGDAVTRGQVLGYVGTSGNAPANTPHLHFGIFALTAEKRWWQGTPIDPFEVLR